MRQLKLIWDFRGPDALKIAKHHKKHLEEFIKQQDTKVNIIGYQEVSPKHSISFMVVNDTVMKPIRDALKPHRGEVYFTP